MADMNLLEMSDEEIAKLDTSFLASTPANMDPVVEETPAVEETVEPPSEETNEDQSQGEQSEDGNTGDEDEEEGNTNEDQGEDKSNTPEVKDGKATEVKQEEVKDEKTEEKKDETSTPESQLAELYKPFKANGRDMQVSSIEEARQLMQMGAGFNKRMGQLKPALKLVKMLENNDLMDESKLSFLIDVSKKDPAAISKLLQESGIDALELDAEKAKQYQGSNHSVSDQQMALEEVLNELEGSPVVAKTLNVVAKDWDDASRQAIAREPQVLKAINSHMENGIFDLISAEKDKKRALGELKGLSDIHAYQQVGDAMHKDGKFAHIGISSPERQQTPPAPVIVQPKLKQAENDEQRNAKRKAAGAKAPVVSSAKPVMPKSLLDMSDDEFEKFNPKFS